MGSVVAARNVALTSPSRRARDAALSRRGAGTSSGGARDGDSNRSKPGSEPTRRGCMASTADASAARARAHRAANDERAEDARNVLPRRLRTIRRRLLRPGSKRGGDRVGVGGINGGELGGRETPRPFTRSERRIVASFGIAFERAMKAQSRARVRRARGGDSAVSASSAAISAAARPRIPRARVPGAEDASAPGRIPPTVPIPSYSATARGCPRDGVRIRAVLEQDAVRSRRRVPRTHAPSSLFRACATRRCVLAPLSGRLTRRFRFAAFHRVGRVDWSGTRPAPAETRPSPAPRSSSAEPASTASAAARSASAASRSARAAAAASRRRNSVAARCNGVSSNRPRDFFG